jgi:hypothetical protein
LLELPELPLDIVVVFLPQDPIHNVTSILRCPPPDPCRGGTSGTPEAGVPTAARRQTEVFLLTTPVSAPCPSHIAGSDAVLAALADAHARRMHAEEEIRLLLAYGRQFVYPHPYTFGELAQAAGMSVSGVRTAFSPQDVEKVATATGLQPVPAGGEDS